MTSALSELFFRRLMYLRKKRPHKKISPAGSNGRGTGRDDLGFRGKRYAGFVLFEYQVSGVSMSAASKACQQSAK
jgi:hypothetical protein